MQRVAGIGEGQLSGKPIELFGGSQLPFMVNRFVPEVAVGRGVTESQEAGIQRSTREEELGFRPLSNWIGKSKLGAFFALATQ